MCGWCGFIGECGWCGFAGVCKYCGGRTFQDLRHAPVLWRMKAGGHGRVYIRMSFWR